MWLRGFLGWCLRIALSAGLGLVAWSASAQNGLQPVPALSAHVIDLSGTLDAPQLKALDDKLLAFETTHGSQVVVLVLHSTAPEDIASYANRVGNAWKIGRKEIGDGLLLLVAKDDHKLRIEVAKSLEGAVPDLAAKQVLDQAITPRFKQGDFAGGLDAGADRIMALILREGLPEPEAAPDLSDSWQEAAFYVVAVDFVLFLLFSAFGGKTGAWIVVFCSVVGAVFGGVAWRLVASTYLAFWSAMSGSFLALCGVMKWGPGSGASGNAMHSDKSGTTRSSSSDSSWSGSSSSSDSSTFSSGGGGDFGGGGASGDW